MPGKVKQIATKKGKKRESTRKTNSKDMFGPITRINTAPVSIGNTISGAQARVTNQTDGARVVGRDFGFQLAATAATVTGWELIGGMPVTPSILASSALRSFSQMHSKFHVNSLCFHYITSSPTSQAGDILFYYERDRSAPMIDFTSNNFLPYMLSDPCTILGPQYLNHSIALAPADEWNSTNYGMNLDINEDTCGSIFIFSKTNATNSPGYLIIDYDITFSERMVNPRAGQFPITRGIWQDTSIGLTAIATTAGTTGLGLNLVGKVLDNTTNGAAPSGVRGGDIFKCVAHVTSSLLLNTWTNVTASNLLVAATDVDTPIIIDDGFTFYAAYVDSAVGGGAAYTWNLYPTLAAAHSLTGSYKAGVTATITFGLICSISLVSALGATNQASY